MPCMSEPTVKRACSGPCMRVTTGTVASGAGVTLNGNQVQV